MSHTANWNEKVARGRRLVTEINDRKWELGDLANEVCPAGPHGAHDDVLRDFADEIGVSRASLHTYRYVAAQWPDVTRVTSQTYTTHKMLAAREDRHEIIAEQVWTYNSLSIRLDRKPNPSRVTPDHEPGNEVRQSVHGLPSMLSEALSSEGSKEALMRTPETRRMVREALSDPQTAKDILKDRRIATAAERAMQSNEDEAETRAESEPMAKLCVMTTDLLSAEQAAAELGISRRALLHRIQSGTIEAAKLGEGRTSAYVIQRAEVERAKKAAARKASA